jgi:exopolyphosphatase/pppGpp-phosphohydrolase
MSDVERLAVVSQVRQIRSDQSESAIHTLDLGSHSVKLYRREGESLRLVRTATWEILDAEISADQMVEFLERFLDGVLDLGGVTALATAAFRRRPKLADTLAAACAFLGISSQIIDQEVEASLMRRALAKESDVASLDAINVGGGSIQVTSPRGSTHLLPFGIADLNRQFSLSAEPSEREVGACRSFVASQLPDWLGEFAYTGGERTYLESFDVTVTTPEGEVAEYAVTRSGDALRASGPEAHPFTLRDVATGRTVASSGGRAEL